MQQNFSFIIKHSVKSQRSKNNSHGQILMLESIDGSRAFVSLLLGWKVCYQSVLHSSYINEPLCKPHCSDRHMRSRCGPHVAKYFQQPRVQPLSSPGFHNKNKGRASVVAATCSVWALMTTLLRTITDLTTCIKPSSLQEY